MEPAEAFAPTLYPPARPSGVMVRSEKEFLWDVELLAQQILKSAFEGRLPDWCMIELLPLLQQVHWDAYAKEAGIASPSRPMIAATMHRFRQLIGRPEQSSPPPEAP